MLEDDDSNDDNFNINNKNDREFNRDLTSKFISRPCYFSPLQCLLNISNKKIFNIVKLSRLTNTNSANASAVAAVAAAVKNATSSLKNKNSSVFILKHLKQQFRRYLFSKTTAASDLVVLSNSGDTIRWQNSLINKLLKTQFALYHQLLNMTYKNEQKSKLPSFTNDKKFKKKTANSNKKHKLINSHSQLIQVLSHTNANITNTKTRFGNFRWQLVPKE